MRHLKTFEGFFNKVAIFDVAKKLLKKVKTEKPDIEKMDIGTWFILTKIHINSEGYIFVIGDDEYVVGKGETGESPDTYYKLTKRINKIPVYAYQPEYIEAKQSSIKKLFDYVKNEK